MTFQMFHYTIIIKLIKAKKNLLPRSCLLLIVLLFLGIFERASQMEYKICAKQKAITGKGFHM